MIELYIKLPATVPSHPQIKVMQCDFVSECACVSSKLSVLEQEQQVVSMTSPSHS